jgi:hypothetical protein
MGGVGVSRARRVRCGAVLLPSRLLPFSSAAFVCRRSLPPRVRGRALTFHTFSSCSVRPPSLPTGVARLCSHACRRRQTAASAARVRRPGGRNRRPSPLQVLRRPSVCRLFFAVCAAAFLSGCRDSVSLPGDLKRHQAKFFCITRCVALKRTRATSPCAGPRHDLSSRARSARTDLAQISRRVRAVIF